MSNKIKFPILCLAFFGNLSLTAKYKDSSNIGTPAIVLKFGTGYYYGLGDLGKRFPQFSTLPAGFFYRSPRNLIFGIEYNRFLGNQYKLDSLYGGIMGPSLQILDKNGFPAVIRYYMRGYSFQGYVGKAFKISPRSKYGQIQANIGGGIMQHYIKMRFDKGILPQLEGNYYEGYDRLTNGFMITQSLYYQYNNAQSLSFYCGINMVESFTKNQRNWDYGTMRKDNANRKDNYFGFAAGILIPIQIKSSNNTEYYD